MVSFLLRELTKGTQEIENNNKVSDSTWKYTKREAGEWLEKLLLSAISNWENKTDMMHSADDFDLVIKTAFVDEAGMLKRFRPAPHGRAHRIRKRSNHVTVVVENKIAIEEEAAKA